MSKKSADDNYVPTGQLQGDDSPMPFKPAGQGADDNYGASLDMDATNSMGSITGATKSDGMDFA